MQRSSRESSAQKITSHSFKARPLRRAQSRRRGIAVVWAALSMTAFLGVAALTVDQGFHLSRRADAQKAADAAALAGAYVLATQGDKPAAVAKAIDYSTRNRYDPNATVGAATVSVTYPIPTPAGVSPAPTPLPSNWIKVHVERDEMMFFGGAFTALMGGARKTKQAVGATAIAEFSSLAPVNIMGGGTYGLNDGPASLSMFGPDARHSFGDYRSTKKLNNGNVNPDYVPDNPNDKDESSGYNFNIKMPAAFNTGEVDIFDPDCHNKDDIADASPGVRLDELRTSGGGQGTAADATITRYRLYADNGTPNTLSDDYLVYCSDGRKAEAYYGDFDSDFVYNGAYVYANSDMMWDTVFSFNRRNYAGQNFRMNAMTIAGASENGYNIRAGQPSDNDGQYNSNGTKKNPPGANSYPGNGTEVTAQGHVPLNFNRSGSVKIALGQIPASVAGREITVRKFDTDVGATNITYTCDTLPGMSWPGRLTTDDQFVTDRFTVPSNYTGGTWYASYTASIQDTSVWDISYVGGGIPGAIRLVR